ncbi:MAG: 50S ribosomal protein L22 [Candidatus Magasanikbacteria bacterium]|nr:50S ribosomal protein L22 [Candidatus Magasanikbacteria bacterium]
MKIRASVKFIRMSARKAALVAALVRGKKAAEAEEILRFTKKIAAPLIAKLLKSAEANAEHNFKIKKEDLLIKSITVGQGPALKRSRARAFGRAAPIKKHTCHINLVLESGGPAETKEEK